MTSRTFTRTAAAALLEPQGLLREGNALLNIGFTAAGAIGPVLAGLTVAFIGIEGALILDAGSFVAVALILTTARSLPSFAGKTSRWWSRLKEGYEYVLSNAALRRLLIANSVLLIFFTSVIPIEIAFVNETLHAGSSGYGALLAFWGVGMLVGSIVFAAAKTMPLRSLLLLGAIAVGSAYIGMSFSKSLAVACLFSAMGGVGNGVFWISIVSAVQTIATKDYQARVVGLLEGTSSLAPGLGFMLGGATAQLFSPSMSLFIGGLGALAVTACALPGLRKMEWTRQGPPDVPAGAKVSMQSSP